jgi:hypothetical protein
MKYMRTPKVYKANKERHGDLETWSGEKGRRGDLGTGRRSAEQDLQLFRAVGSR